MATNELLLDQNAHLRIHGKPPQTSVTSVTVTVPSVTLPVTSLGHHHGLATASIPTVQTVQALATLPLVTALAQSGSAALGAPIPFATSVSLTSQPSVPLATVSIAPVTLNHQPQQQPHTVAAVPVCSLPSAGSATVTLTPAGTLHHHLHHHPVGHSSTLTFSAGADGGSGSGSGSGGSSLVSYPAIMTQNLMASAAELLPAQRHVDFT